MMNMYTFQLGMLITMDYGNYDCFLLKFGDAVCFYGIYRPFLIKLWFSQGQRNLRLHI